MNACRRFLQLTRVSIPSTVERIQSLASIDCDSLGVLKNLKYVGDWTFDSCKNLQAVALSEVGVIRIGG